MGGKAALETDQGGELIDFRDIEALHAEHSLAYKHGRRHRKAILRHWSAAAFAAPYIRRDELDELSRGAA